MNTDLLNFGASAKSLGKPFLSPYLNSLGSDFSYGANFANSAATITPPKNYLLPNYRPPHGWSPFYLYVQYLQFQEFIERSQIIRREGNFFVCVYI